MISPLFTQGCMKVLTLFSLSQGSRFSRKEMQEKTRLGNIQLDHSLSRLTSCGVLRKEKRLYSLDFGNEEGKILVNILAKEHKRFREIPLSVFFLLSDIADSLSEIKGCEALLFGSYAKLVQTSKSDVDIAIISSRPLDRKAIASHASKRGKHYGKEIEIHHFDKNSFYKNKGDPLVKSILKEGIYLVRG